MRRCSGEPERRRWPRMAAEGETTGKGTKDTVKLISAEGFEFLVDYKAACVSATVKNMLTSQGALHTLRQRLRLETIVTCSDDKIVVICLCDARCLYQAWPPGSCCAAVCTRSLLAIAANLLSMLLCANAKLKSH